MTPYRPRTLTVATLLATAGLAALVALSTSAAAAPTPTPTLTLPTGDLTPWPSGTAPTLGTSPSPPTAPTDLHVTAVTSSSVTLAWTAATPTTVSIAGYNINYNQAFNDIYWSQQIGNVTTATITDGIRPTGQYSFRVIARDDLGHTGASSNTVVVVTPASDTAADRTPPTAPGNLQVAGVTGSSAQLTWTGSTDDVGVTGYNVYRFDGLYVSTLVGTTTGTTLTAPLPTAAIGSWYVRAKDAAGNLSAVSNTANAPPPTTTTPPPAPACTVTWHNSSQWSSGFVADVTVASTTAVDGWSATLTLGGDQRVTNAWNAAFSQSGRTVTLTAAGWNRKIPAGGSATVGLLGSWRTSNAPPTAAALNGASCEVTAS
ncbi:cellulose binding domain-containing protein [Actinoplanes sp. NPDC026619]|uniref:cellulose binding domain-containing protein n=1 Tax=Actinoplanes sp. NPDC026619 TaxID=3155798 RepID=UPI0033EC49AA